MPDRIATLRRQAPEIGRLRGGQKDDKNKPERLDTWRATSKNETAIRALSSIYGGDVAPWPDRPGEWEIITETNALDVLLPSNALFTAYEMWGSGGNQRRCDGERCTIPVQGPDGGGLQEVDCLCDEAGLVPGVDKKACGITVRLKVVLPNVPGMGIWLVTSSSIYAAMELPAQVDFIEGALGVRPGMLIPCKLLLDHRDEKKAWEKFRREYNVPSLLINDSLQRLQQQVDGPQGQRAFAPARQTLSAPSAVGPSDGPGFESAAPSTGSAVQTGAGRHGEPVVDTGDPTTAAPPATPNPDAYQPKGKGWTLSELKTIALHNGFEPDESDTLTSLSKALRTAGLI